MICLQTQNIQRLSLTPVLKQTPGNQIYFLENSPYFFMDFVFIIAEKYAFRLLVYDRRENYLVDKRYATVKGAKIAFLNLFGHKYYNEDPIAIWDPPYTPDEKWLQEKLAFIAGLPDHAKQKRVRGKRVSLLSNPGLFSLDYAFILDLKTGYRLLAHDRDENVLFDDIYKTVGGAKMSFRIMFGHKYALGKPAPVWAPFSQPLEAWWKQKNRFIASRTPEYIKRRKKK